MLYVKRYLLILFITSFTMVSSLQANSIKNFFNKKDFKKVMLLSDQCIKDIKKSKDHELCLYYGNLSAEKYVDIVMTTAFKSGAKYFSKNISDWKEVIFLNTLDHGVSKPPLDIGLIYHHNYCKILIKKFPQSKHAPECSYKLISVESNNWKEEKKLLESYLKKYNNMNTFTLSAKLDLARIHDNLWELINPKSTHTTYRASFISGDIRKDLKTSEIHREKALSLYHFIMSVKINILSQDIEKSKKYISNRYVSLQERKPSNRLYIIND